MKLLIIGLDGLDLNLMSRWKVNWFMQKYWGKHYIGFLREPYTPIVWGCFLTGVNVEKYGYTIQTIQNMRDTMKFRSKILYNLYQLRKRLIPVRNLGVRRILVKLKLANTCPPAIMPKWLIKLTFIEKLKAEGYRIVAIEVPGYNEYSNEYYRSMCGNLISKPFSIRRKFIELALKDTEERIRRSIKFVEDEYDLVFTYSPLPDLAFHIVGLNPPIHARVWLRILHYRLYRVVKELIDLAKERNYITLIVSDHGFDIERHYHSEYGFWSLNVKPPNWKIESILDFKRNIVEIVREGFEGAR